jgi:TFIIIC subunit triple barrel domain
VQCQAATGRLKGIAAKQGLDTRTPQLQLDNGTTLTGQYEEMIGACVLFTDKLDSGGKHAVQYLAHTERRLTFHLPKDGSME